jgi:glutamate N-acetyltransferase/amino-acid N-acetyltransferase
MVAMRVLPDVTTGDAICLPKGFVTYAGNAGIKDSSLDLSIVAGEGPCVAAGVFTQSLFAGPSVTLSRRHLADGSARALVTVSKNANVATGAPGERDAEELAELTAKVVGCARDDVVVCSTGVIGRRYPMERIRGHFASLSMPEVADFQAIARAIMTTDTRPKLASAPAGSATVMGLAKGSGMIEPDMATLLAYVFTDAEVPAPDLDAMWRRAVDATFNCLSIDTDTSTSDSAVVMASGAAGEVEPAQLEGALLAVCRSLTVQLAADGEGATKVLQVQVAGAADAAQAKRVAKTIVSSPLVKCAVHGADPNWGRVVMAIGKCWQETGISAESVRVSFGGLEVYPHQLAARDLDRLAQLMAESTVEIGVRLGDGPGEVTVWGCDLSPEYVHINAYYTT